MNTQELKKGIKLVNTHTKKVVEVLEVFKYSFKVKQLGNVMTGFVNYEHEIHEPSIHSFDMGTWELV